MLPLVRSQQTCIERIRSAVRWAKRLVVLVGAPGQGKSLLIEALILKSPVNPLHLHGELISDRSDAVLRLVGLVGLRPEGTEVEMLSRLQTKKQVDTEHGVPEIIVDDAHCLPNEVSQLFHELSYGAYGRHWSVLLVGEDNLIPRLQSLRPLPALASTVMLPHWDQYDLEEACSRLYPNLDLSIRGPQVLQHFAMQPKQLLRAIAEEDSSVVIDVDEDAPDGKQPAIRIPSSYLIAAGIAVAAIVAALLFVQMNNEDPETRSPTPIPLAPNQR